jgi:type I restriction enzyme S subunit
MELEGNSRYICRANNYLDCDLARLLRFTIFPKETVVFAKVGAALLLNRRRILAQDTILDNNMMGLIANDVDNLFLYYFMQSVDLGLLVQTGALPSVNQEIVGDIEVPDFPFPDQRKIARILTTVDNLIEKTEALIAKYQAVKQGMMHELQQHAHH